MCVFEGECKLSVGSDLPISMQVAGFIYNYYLIYILMHIYILFGGICSMWLDRHTILLVGTCVQMAVDILVSLVSLWGGLF